MIPAEIQDELDSSLRWWNREYARLLEQAFVVKPFVEAEHKWHRTYEDFTYGGRRIVGCADCPIEWVPRV